MRDSATRRKYADAQAGGHPKPEGFRRRVPARARGQPRRSSVALHSQARYSRFAVSSGNGFCAGGFTRALLDVDGAEAAATIDRPCATCGSPDTSDALSSTIKPDLPGWLCPGGKWARRLTAASRHADILPGSSLRRPDNSPAKVMVATFAGLLQPGPFKMDKQLVAGRNSLVAAQHRSHFKYGRRAALFVTHIDQSAPGICQSARSSDRLAAAGDRLRPRPNSSKISGHHRHPSTPTTDRCADAVIN